MTTTTDNIRHLLESAFPPTHLHIEDESWKHAGHAGAKEHGGGHFVLHITSEKFDGLSRPQSHRRIYQALASLFPADIHALSIQVNQPNQDSPRA